MREQAVEGFIYLHRQLRDHPYWESPERLKAWIDIIFMAAWKDHRRMIGTQWVTLKRGEFFASERFLSKRWNWSRGKVRRFLETALETNELRTTKRTTNDTSNGTSNGTTYVVVKYEDYQNHRPRDGTRDDTRDGTRDGTSDGPPKAEKRTTKRTTNDTTQDVVEYGTYPDHRPRDGTSDGPPKAKKQYQIEEENIKNNKGERSTKIPKGWKPNKKHGEIATTEGVDVTREADNFRDHATANGRYLIDWDAGFRMWLHKAGDGWGKKTPKPPRTHLMTAEEARVWAGE